MVRHEAAEALGGIATPEVVPYLKEYMTREDAPTVVRESCEVALDMYEVGVSSFPWNTIMWLSSAFADHSMKIQTNSSMPMVLVVRDSARVEFATLSSQCIVYQTIDSSILVSIS